MDALEERERDGAAGRRVVRLRPGSLRIAEIRAYYAAPADREVTINELVGFDYAGRGYPLASAT